MKQIYVKPTMKSVSLFMDPVMIASSIQNIEGETQTGIDVNDKDDFEAGAKKHDAWTTWDD